MKKTAFFAFVWLMAMGSVSFAQTTDINLGRIFFPRPFVHAEKDFPKGTYHVLLTQKDNVPFFRVSNAKKELLFDEMAVIQPKASKGFKSGWRVRRELLKGNEYFRLRVTKPGELVTGYFLTKAAPPPVPAK